MTSPQTKCRLIALPSELRNHVYEVVIAGYNKLDQLDFINTGRQTRAEALSLFYQLNTFEIFGGHRGSTNHTIFCRWLKFIGEANAEVLQHVRFILFDDGQKRLDMHFDRTSRSVRGDYNPTSENREEYLRLILPGVDKARRSGGAVKMWRTLSGRAMPFSWP